MKHYIHDIGECPEGGSIVPSMPSLYACLFSCSKLWRTIFSIVCVCLFACVPMYGLKSCMMYGDGHLTILGFLN